MISKYLSKILYPLLDKKRKTHVLNDFEYLKKTQFLSKDELEKIQLKKLNEIICHAYQNVPYYRRVFQERNILPEDIMSLKDLEKIPVLTKEIIRANFNDLLDKNYQSYNCIRGSTSGSTGQPLIHLKTREAESMALASVLRLKDAVGYKIGDRVLNIGGTVAPGIPNHSPKEILNHLIMRPLSDIITNSKTLSTVNMSEITLADYLRVLTEYKPDFLSAAPSGIESFTKYLIKRGYKKTPWKPRAIFTTAEMLYSDQRNLIEKFFCCDVYDSYGSGEYITGAFQCNKKNLYHQDMELGIIEVVKNGKSVKAGELGNVLLTGFYNKIMPFIRYEIGDAAVISNKPCKCGRGLITIEKIEGKVRDLIYTKGGKLINGEFLHTFDTDWILEYQLIQERSDFIILNLVPSRDKFQKAKVEKLRNYLKKELPGVKIDINLLDKIDTTKWGKRYRIISKVKKPF